MRKELNYYYSHGWRAKIALNSFFVQFDAIWVALGIAPTESGHMRREGGRN